MISSPMLSSARPALTADRRLCFRQRAALNLVVAFSHGAVMGDDDKKQAEIIAALAQDSPAAWETFVHWASPRLWAACLRASSRKAAAERLFAEIIEAIYDDRFALARRFADSGLASPSAFLDNEIGEGVGRHIVAGFRAGAPEAADRLVRYFHADIKTWIQRASAPGERNVAEDRAQDVYAMLLDNEGRRLAAYPGGGSFRLFLRRLVLNALTDSLRRDQGRARPKAALARLTPLEQKAYCLLYEDRLSHQQAVARLADPRAADAVKTARELGDLGPLRARARPRLVGFDDRSDMIDPPAPDRDPEAALIHLEDVARETERENALLAALRDEPPDVRRILQARFIDGLKPRQIADAVGCDVKDVYRILERALARIKQHLARP